MHQFLAYEREKVAGMQVQGFLDLFNVLDLTDNICVNAVIDMPSRSAAIIPNEWLRRRPWRVFRKSEAGISQHYAVAQSALYVWNVDNKRKLGYLDMHHFLLPIVGDICHEGDIFVPMPICCSHSIAAITSVPGVPRATAVGIGVGVVLRCLAHKNRKDQMQS